MQPVEVINQWVSKLHPDDKIEKVDLNDFFERAIAPKGWHTDEDKAQLLRLKNLKDFFNRSTRWPPSLPLRRGGD